MKRVRNDTETLPRHTHHAHPRTNRPRRSVPRASSSLLASRSRSWRSLRPARGGSAPRDVPIGAPGPPAGGNGAIRTRGTRRLRRHVLPGEAAAGCDSRPRGLRRHRVRDPAGARLLIATGASPTVAQMLAQIGNGLGPPRGPPAASPRTSPRPPMRIPAAPDWPRRRYRSPSPACCPQSCWCSRSSARSGLDSPPSSPSLGGGRPDDRRAAALRVRFDEGELWGVAAGLRWGAGLRAVDARSGLAVRPHRPGGRRH